MTRHSKSNNDGAVFTYYERQQQSQRASGGAGRLGGGSFKAWHECGLSLRTPVDAVVTPGGVVYDREAIAVHLLRQKEDARARRGKKRCAQAHDMEKLRRQEEEVRAQRERDAEQALHAHSSQTIVDSPAHIESWQAGGVPNFWLPGAPGIKSNSKHTHSTLPSSFLRVSLPVPPAKRRKQAQVSSRTVCPVSGAPLRLRDLITLRPTRVPDIVGRAVGLSNASIPIDQGSRFNLIDSYSATSDEGEDKGNKRRNNLTSVSAAGDASSDSPDGLAAGNRGHASPFICPLCRVPLTNATKPAALRSGSVLCVRCVDTFVRQDARDPVTATSIDLARDVIAIDNSGTAFAASDSHNPALREAYFYRPSVT